MPEPQHQAHPDTLRWLHQLYGPVEDGWLTLFSLDRTDGTRHVDWAPVDHLDQLATIAADREPHGCVWFGVATRARRLAGGQRGGSADCVAIPGLWVDLDIEGPGHRQGERLLADRAAALDLIAAFPVPPTVIVDSGGGLQPWWLLDEPLELAGAGSFLADWGATWAAIGADHDVHIDNVFEPARVMRLPGTTNRKEGLARPVQILEAHWDRRYGTDDLDQHLLAAPPAPTHATGGTRLPYIGPERPGDAFNARHSGGDVLSAHGFTLARRTNGDEHWVRPGKDARDGTSATVYGDDGHTTIWSDTCAAQWPTLEVRRPYDPFFLHVHLAHGGDSTTATRDLRAKGYGGPREDPVIALAEPTISLVSADSDEEWPEPRPIVHDEPPPPWPTGTFPDWIEDQVANIAAAMQTDPAMAGIAALGALSVIALGHADVQARTRHIEHLALYLVTVAKVSAGKSPVQGAMFDPIWTFETECVDQQRAERGKAEAERKILDKQASRAADLAAATGEPDDMRTATDLAAKAESHEMPSAGRLITTDITPERVASIMRDNDERITVVTDEPDVLNVDRYGDARRGRNMAVFLQAWSGRPVSVDRQGTTAGGSTIQLRRPLMTMVVASQPEPWARVIADQELRDRGFAQRFMADHPQPPPGLRNQDLDYDVRDEAIDDTYRHGMLALARRMRSYGSPLHLTLSPAAKAAWRPWANDLEARAAFGGDLELEAGWLSKMRDSVIRTAALLHIADHATDTPIPTEVTGDAMERAMAVGTYWLEHRLHSLDVVNEETGALRMLAALKRLSAEADDGWITKRQIGRGGPRGMRKEVEAAAPIAVLERHGYLRLRAQDDTRDPVARLVESGGILLHPDARQARDKGATPRDTSPPPVVGPHDERDLSRASRASPDSPFSEHPPPGVSPGQPEMGPEGRDRATDGPSEPADNPRPTLGMWAPPPANDGGTP